MTTINETPTGITGNEIGTRVLALYGLIPPQPGPSSSPPAFDFAKEMRKITLTVDQYLTEGQVKEAEAFMEQSHQYLADQSYYNRKLN
jgi:hypothetical protein